MMKAPKFKWVLLFATGAAVFCSGRPMRPQSVPMPWSGPTASAAASAAGGSFSK
jgi:hypothetical protein